MKEYPDVFPRSYGVAPPRGALPPPPTAHRSAPAGFAEALTYAANLPVPPLPARAAGATHTTQQALEAGMRARWGNTIDVLAQRPGRDHPRPAIWMSKRHAGAYGLFLPGRDRPLVTESLERAHACFADAGYGRAAPKGQRDIHVDGSMPTAACAQLERDHGISITPLVVHGREIAYLLAGHAGPTRTVLLCAEHTGSQGTFSKPPGIELCFAAGEAPDPLEFAAVLGDGTGRLDPTRVHGFGVEDVADHPLAASPLPVDQAAAFVGRSSSGEHPFGLVLLNPQARKVTLGAVMQSLTALDVEPNRLVCHLARART